MVTRRLHGTSCSRKNDLASVAWQRDLAVSALLFRGAVALTILLIGSSSLFAAPFREVYAFPPGFVDPNPNGLTLANDGTFYGTTSTGGSNGLGSVFRVTTNGVLTPLASFADTNGDTPQADLVLGNDGAFYGTTSFGGSDSVGSVFRVTTNGVLTTV